MLKGSVANPTLTVANFINADVNGQYTPMSLPNTDFAEDFRVMDQGTVELTSQVILNGVNKMVDVSIPLSFHQTYTSTTAASLEDGIITILIVALNIYGTAGFSGCQVTSRLWYIDN
jgi:hypothetical protein